MTHHSKMAMQDHPPVGIGNLRHRLRPHGVAAH